MKASKRVNFATIVRTWGRAPYRGHTQNSEASHDLPPCSPVPSSVNNASGTRELSMNFDQFRNLSPMTCREIAEA